MKKILNSILVLFLCLSLFGCKTKVIVEPEIVNEKFQQFTDELVGWYYGENSVSAYFDFAHPEKFGIVLAKPDFTIPSYEKVLENVAEAEEHLKTLRGFDYDSLNPTEKMTYDLLEYDLHSTIELADVYYFRMGALGNFLGANCNLPYYYIAWPLLSKEYLDGMIYSIDNLLPTFQNWIDFELEKIAHGYPMSRNSYEGIVSNAQKIVDAGDNYFLIDQVVQRVATVPGLSATEIAEYQKIVAASLKTNYIGAYRLLVEQIPRLYDKAPDPEKSGLPYFVNGDKYYRYMLKYNVGVDASPQEIYDYLEKKLNDQFTLFLSTYNAHSDYADIEYLFPIMDNNNKIDDVMAFLAKETMKEFPTIKQPEFFTELVDETQQENFSPAAYFTPLLDSDYPNLILINPSSKSSKYSTIAHETYPGHLYQFNYVSQSDLPMIRKIISVTGYSEAWATYTEHRSIKYVPKIKDYQIIIYQLNDDIIYTLWCMIDIGINDQGWGIEKVQEFLAPYLGDIGYEGAEYFFDVVQENPTNMLQYYYTYYLLEDYKAEFFKTAKKPTELMFNTALVEVGAVPFPLLKKHLKAVAEKSK